MHFVTFNIARFRGTKYHHTLSNHAQNSQQQPSSLNQRAVGPKMSPIPFEDNMALLRLATDSRGHMASERGKRFLRSRYVEFLIEKVEWLRLSEVLV